MDVYVGVTDWQWFDYLRDHNMAEVNFWKPGGGAFKTISEGDLFLFKMKAAHGGRIAGGGFFVGASTTTIDWAWRAFGNENGVENLAQLSDAIWQYRGQDALHSTSTNVTNIILTDTFYFDECDWIDISSLWNRAIVAGKTFRGKEATWLVNQVQMRLQSQGGAALPQTQSIATRTAGGYVLVQTKHRIGQGAFRTLVADAYQRRCAITGERTVPVLQAAHIKAFSAEGPNAVDNGILLRSDLHALFDAGYLTIEDDLRIAVSPRLHEDYGNGKDYYPFHGRRLTVVPDEQRLRPAKEYLEWHQEHVFLG